MGRAGNTALTASLWLVRVLTVGLAVGVAGLFLWFAVYEPAPVKLAPRPLPEVAPPVEQPREAGGEAPPPTEIEEDLPALPGPTRFVRRLVAGERLNRLWGDAGSSECDVPATAMRLKQLTRDLLRADRYLIRTCDTREQLSKDLDYLVHPPRDLEHVRLTDEEPDDPLGTRKLVRVWTLGTPHPVDELRRARESIGHVAAVAGVEVPGGFDVLVTPQRGADVFPNASSPTWAAGTYSRSDRYCTVRSTLSPLFREEVLKHELVHAYCHGISKDIVSSRFVSEGLAEYLRLCAPSDEGLRVPRHRLANQLARLEEMLRWIRLEHFTPARLVVLTPDEFYALRHFSYLMAQASMAYIGGAVIERAFRERSDRAIIAAVHAIKWADFERFVKDHAKAGDASSAIVIEDVTPETIRNRKDLEKVRRALLKDLGFKLAPRKRGEDPFLDTATGLLSDPRQIAYVLKRILAAEGPHTLVSDTSAAMDRMIELAAVPAALAPLKDHDFAAGTGRQFAVRIHEILYRNRDVRVVRMSPDSESGGQAVLDAVSPYQLNAAVLTESTMVVCIASKTRKRPDWTKLARKLARRLAAKATENVLVIDLSDGTGDAATLAEFLAARQDTPLGTIAYWRPLRSR